MEIASSNKGSQEISPENGLNDMNINTISGKNVPGTAAIGEEAIITTALQSAADALALGEDDKQIKLVVAESEFVIKNEEGLIFERHEGEGQRGQEENGLQEVAMSKDVLKRGRKKKALAEISMNIPNVAQAIDDADVNKRTRKRSATKISTASSATHIKAMDADITNKENPIGAGYNLRKTRSARVVGGSGHPSHTSWKGSERNRKRTLKYHLETYKEGHDIVLL